ncbi:MAG: hypothetical protein D6737_05125 [Chloroflexi bacterium]|nr:MAG: hypothetical protein CUN54_01950 [Phototrophicales bacterium]RMF81371.1 MAG: hypothetical protein D6737_05125 [Chloroflexota bacterium]
MRRKWFIRIILILMIFAATGTVAARDIIRGDMCHIEAETVINSNVFVLCRTLIIDGTINGNLLGTATAATLNGTISGDVYLIAGQLDVTGILGDDLHFAGPVLRIEQPAEFQNEAADILSLSLSTRLFQGAKLPNSLINVGYQLIIDGEVGGEVNFWGSALEIDGIVDGDVDANVGDSEATSVPRLQSLLIPFSFDVNLINPGLRLAETGEIKGELRYSAPTEGIIDGQVGESIIFLSETTDFTPAIPLVEPEQPASQEANRYISRVIGELIPLGIIGMVGILIMPRYLARPAKNLQNKPLSNLALGLLSFIVSFPIIVIIAFVSILIVLFLLFLQQDNLAIFLAIVLGVVDLGGASIFYFIAIFIARVVVCLAIGRIVMRSLLIDDGSQRYLLVSLLPGVVLVSLFVSLPFVGLLLNALAAFIGLGAILTTIRNRLRVIRAATPPMTNNAHGSNFASAWSTTTEYDEYLKLPETIEEAIKRPPPIPHDPIRPLGMDNLPEGFEWWDDES